MNRPVDRRARTRGVRVLVAAAFFLFVLAWLLATEHRAHLSSAAFYLILLLCPFMHFFMHGGHRHAHHSHSGAHADDTPEQRKSAQ